MWELKKNIIENFVCFILEPEPGAGPESRTWSWTFALAPALTKKYRLWLGLRNTRHNTYKN